VIVHRIRSRSINIFFKKPSVAPTNEEEEENFSELQSLISSGESSKCRICSVLVSSDEMSAMLGWEIRLGKLLSSKEGRKEVKDLKESLRGTFAGRSQANWAILFFLVKKVGCIYHVPILKSLLCSSLSIQGHISVLVLMTYWKLPIPTVPQLFINQQLFQEILC
jgi:hypothetical protein